ncbi:MAG: NADH-quinone oxidoreductase subunit C [Acidobacteria bacterium]|nr:NADH-quinone oxidoreductase subunit C [Acidobacteriota bacterium]
MPPAAPITGIEQLREREPLNALLASREGAIEGARFDRDELTLEIRREAIAEVCEFLRHHEQFGFLADVTCTDWYPEEPRFHVVYSLLSHARKLRVRLKVKVAGADARVPALTPMWPAADYFEREVFDLFGVRFEGHPYLRRIQMPDDWQGHPLRKDYPVEGYR